MKNKAKQSVSRRRFLGVSAGAAAGAVSGIGIGAGETPMLQAQAPAAAAAQDQDLHLTNGRIHTMDARNSIVRNVTIRNGRFVTVSDAAPPRTPGARVIDLK